MLIGKSTKNTKRSVKYVRLHKNVSFMCNKIFVPELNSEFFNKRKYSKEHIEWKTAHICVYFCAHTNILTCAFTYMYMYTGSMNLTVNKVCECVECVCYKHRSFTRRYTCILTHTHMHRCDHD